jgi:hypothetical protein
VTVREGVATVGRAETGSSVSKEKAVVAPYVFVPVTATRISKPVSDDVSLKVFFVAPVIGTHVESTYFCHWNVSLGTGDPVQCKAVEVAVIVEPTAKEGVLDDMVGRVELKGILPTAVVLFAHRTKVPAMFVPVDATVINLPLSALTSV